MVTDSRRARFVELALIGAGALVLYTNTPFAIEGDGAPRAALTGLLAGRGLSRTPYSLTEMAGVFETVAVPAWQRARTEFDLTRGGL